MQHQVGVRKSDLEVSNEFLTCFCRNGNSGLVQLGVPRRGLTPPRTVYSGNP